MTDEAQANLEELIVELQAERAQLDPEWEDEAIKRIDEQIALVEGKLASGEDSEPEPQFSKKDVTSESTPLGMKAMEVTVNGEKSIVTHTDLRTLDTPRKRWLYYWEHGQSVNDAKDFVKHIDDMVQEKGYTMAEMIQWHNQAWDKVVGGKKNFDAPYRWDVLNAYFEIADVAPEITDDSNLELFENLTAHHIDWVHAEEGEKDSWDRALKALGEAERELQVLAAQYKRMCAPAERLKNFLENVYLNSPAADDFVERNKKKGTQYVDLPHGRIQKRAVAESLSEVDEMKLKGFIGTMGADTKDSLNITPYTSYRFEDSRKKFKEWLDKQDAETIEKAGYKRRPKYSNITADFGKGEK